MLLLCHVKLARAQDVFWDNREIVMADRYINKTCNFMCSCAVGNNRFYVMNETKSGVYLHRKPILTNLDMLEAFPGIFCTKQPNPQGTPPYLPCSLKSVGMTWRKCSKNSCCGHNLLTERSYAICNGFLGKLTVLPFSLKICMQDRPKEKGLLPEIIPKNISVKKDSHQHKSDTENQRNKESRKPKEQGQEKVKDSDIIMKCPYSQEKEKCRKCSYMLARTDMVETAFVKGKEKNPSKILRDNYRADFYEVKINREYLNRFKSYEDEIDLFCNNHSGNVAHHIISTKDVLMQPQVKFVLKLVNFYQWDINGAFNCILLSGNEERDDLTGLLESQKTEVKYQIMNAVKRQWHGGGHAYSAVDVDEFEGNYAMLVTNKLMEVMDTLSNSFCRQNNGRYYERGREEFIRKINKFIAIICNKLANFEKDPRLSHPFYVSSDAFRFAYGIPQSCKLLFVKYGKMQDKLMVYKYIAFRKSGDGRIVTFDFRGMKKFVLNNMDETQKNERMLILFCEQIDVIILDRNGYDVEFPFSVTYIYDVGINRLEPQEYLAVNRNAIGVFLSQCKKDGQESCLRRRLLELQRKK